MHLMASFLRQLWRNDLQGQAVATTAGLRVARLRVAHDLAAAAALVDSTDGVCRSYPIGNR